MSQGGGSPSPWGPPEERSARPWVAPDDRPAWLPPPPPATPAPGGPKPRRARRWAVLALVVVLVAVGGGLVLATHDPEPTRQPAPPASSAATPTTKAPSPPAVVSAEIRAISERVERVRRLTFERPVPAEVLSNKALAARLLQQVDKDTDETSLRRIGRALIVLGELPAGTDLATLLRELQAESVLGFYVPGSGADKGRLYARSEGGITPFAEWVLSHELTHALTDQHFDLTLADKLQAPGRDDELTAYLALVEGDATLAMQQYLQTQMDRPKQLEVAREALGQPSERTDRAPAAVRESLQFPYEAGLAFVRALYQQGGWAAVDKAYRDPPTSTEQILHPERYLRRDAPTAVAVPDLAARLGPGWRAAATAGWGEFDTQLLLESELPVSAARGAAAGWDGGRLRTFERGGDTALALRLAFDSGAEATEFCGTAVRWASSRLGAGTRTGGATRWSGKGQQAQLTCSGAHAAWLSAPDTTTLDRLSAGLGTP
jgi:hypothetical protein